MRQPLFPVLVVFLICELAVSADRARAGTVKQARRLFQQAEEKYRQKDFAAALALYRQAFEQKPLAGFHFNIAQCYRNLGQHQQAVEHFQQYLESAKNPRNRADAERLMQLSQRALDVERQEQSSREAEVERQAKAEAKARAAAAAAGAPAVVKPAPRRSHGVHRAYFWSGVGVTALLLAAGTVTGTLALGKSAEYKDPSTPYGKLQQLSDSGTALKTTSTVTFAVGAAAAVTTGVLLFVTDFGEARTATEPRVTIGPCASGGMVTVGGGF